MMDPRSNPHDAERKLTPLEVAAQNLTSLHAAIVAKQHTLEEMKSAMSRMDCELANLVIQYAKQQAALRDASTHDFSADTKGRLSREMNQHPMLHAKA